MCQFLQERGEVFDKFSTGMQDIHGKRLIFPRIDLQKEIAIEGTNGVFGAYHVAWVVLNMYLILLFGNSIKVMHHTIG